MLACALTTCGYAVIFCGFAALVCLILFGDTVDDWQAREPLDCPRPDRADLVGDGGDAAECFYSHTYDEARRRFVDAAHAAGAEHYVLALDERQYAGLFIDVAVVRGRNDQLVLHVSGTHGTEGFTGSAIQTAALAHELVKQQHQQQYESDRQQLPTVVYVHALNPYGMAAWRRWNEDGVDLNRNAMFADEAWARVLQRRPDVAGYDALNHLFNPSGPPSWLWFATRWLPEIAYLWATDAVRTKRALVTGTYTRRGGIFYGGTALARSHVRLRDFLQQHGFVASVRAVAVVDVHTGLGPSGVDTLMLHAPDDALEARRLFVDGNRERFAHALEHRADCDANAATTTASLAAAASSGYALTAGTVSARDGYASLFVNASVRALVTQEFGTVSPMYVAIALVRENQAFHSLPPDATERRRAHRAVYDAFVPPTRSARANTVHRGLALLQQVVHKAFEGDNAR